MSGETPDWGALSVQSTVFPVTDLGEAVARLGSLNTFDRRGDMLWGDGFECSLNKWIIVTAGTGAAVALSTDRARNGRYSALLTAGSDGTRIASITRRAPFPVAGPFGLELSFNLPGTIETFNLQFQMFDGTNVVSGAVRWVDADDELQYTDSAGAWVTFRTGVDLLTSTKLFHTIKLVVDLSAQEYLRIILDDVDFSLAGIAAHVAASGTLPVLDAIVTLIGRAGQNDEVYVDDAIITQNEPA